MLGVVEVRGCACWWWLIFELVLAIPAKAPAKTCWGCSPYPSVTFAHDCKGGTFVRVRGEQLENGTSEANGKSKVQTCILRLFALPESRVVRQYRFPRGPSRREWVPAGWGRPWPRAVP